MNCKVYKVGGSVRDYLLGRPCNDFDFTFVVDDNSLSLDEGFLIMKEYMLSNGYTIFLETPECVTIRGKMPHGIVGDFVLARKEVGYIQGTRRPLLELGSLEDDLIRRDFTVNSLARDEDDNLIDLFNGYRDLQEGVLRTPLDPMVTLTDDPLRALRAVRFAIQLDFVLDEDLLQALYNPELVELMHLVSTDRIRDELKKCFKFDTWSTFKILSKLPEDLVKCWISTNGLWLKPTTERR